jgi:hypothetical protein
LSIHLLGVARLHAYGRFANGYGAHALRGGYSWEEVMQGSRSYLLRSR